MEVCEHVLLRVGYAYEIVEARAYLAGKSPEALHQLRFQMAARGERPAAVCPYCKEPLRLAGGRQEVGGPRSPTLHFRHRMNPAVHCIQKSEAHFTPDEIRAIKYCGQRESRLHYWTKTALAEALEFTQGIEPDSVRIEQRFPASDRRSWRQPDVRAQWRAHDLVFEAQLDTTHISVLAERDAFYREQKSRLLWVFAVPPDRRLRFVEKDVLYNYRGNLFVFDSDCMARSKAAGHLILQAWWMDAAWLALTHDERPEEVRWHSRYISLEDLVLPADGAPPYFVDALHTEVRVASNEDTLSQILEDPWETELRERIEVKVLRRPPPAHWTAIPFPDRKPVARDARPRSELGSVVAQALHALGASASPSVSDIWAFCKFGKAIFALEAGRPVYTNLKSLIQVENVVYASNRAFYGPFCYALRHIHGSREGGALSRKHQDTHQQHKAEFRSRLMAGDERYRQDHRFDLLIYALWPWIEEEMRRPTHWNSRRERVPADILTGITRT